MEVAPQTPPGVPSAEECAELPALAGAAYAARCARRIQHLARHSVGVKDEVLRAIERGIRAVEEFSQSGSESDFIPVIEAIPSFEGRSSVIDVSGGEPVARVANLTKSALVIALSSHTEPKPYEVAKCPINVISALAAAATVSNDFEQARQNILKAFHAVRRDFDLLKDEAIGKRWGRTDPVPKHFFAVHSDFDVERRFEGRSIIDVAPFIDEKLIAFFGRHPEELRKIAPRQFEELIAELFAGFGFEVDLTAMTRDGGRDIIAIKYEPARVKYLVECKRFVPPNKVGISVIQRLHGVTLSEGASKGIIATTSYFSAPAMQHIEKHQYVLDGRDYDGLLKWLDLYQKFRMATIFDA